MSAKSVILCSAIVFCGMTAAMMLTTPDVPVASLEAGLGPVVETNPL